MQGQTKEKKKKKKLEVTKESDKEIEHRGIE